MISSNFSSLRSQSCVQYYLYIFHMFHVNTSWSFPRSWLITGFVTRLTRRVKLVGQELFGLPEHLSSPPVFSGVRVTRSLVLYVCFVHRCLFLCTFSFDHFVVCSSLIYGFWFFFDIRILITPLVSSNSSWQSLRFSIAFIFDLSPINIMTSFATSGILGYFRFLYGWCI